MGSSLLYTVAALTAIGFSLIGYDNGVLGGVINNKPFQDTFGNPTASLLGTMVAIYDVGCCVGALICAVVAEPLGRRKSIFLGAVVMLIGAAVQASVSTPGALIAGRIVSGLGMGFINSTAPVLMAEFSPKATRGRYVCLQLSVLNFGIMLAYWVGYGFTRVSGSKAWRIPVALQGIFIIPIMVLVFFVSESPRWLASHGRTEEALLVIARAQGRSPDHPEVRYQHEEILLALNMERASGDGSWMDLFRDDEIKSRRRFLIACSIQAFQQAGGINGIIYYAGNLLSATGLSSSGASLVSGLLFTWLFVASFIPWFLIDSVGRRILLLVCISAMACCFAAEAGLISAVQRSPSTSRSAGIAATAFLFLYMGLFTTGFQAVTWVYPSEILPLQMRQRGSAISTACNWIINYAVVQITPIALENIGYKYYIIFAILNASFVPVIYVFYPETKGMSLEAIDELFAHRLLRPETHGSGGNVPAEHQPALEAEKVEGDEGKLSEVMYKA